ncbi:HlyD family efflux transporter periplasmic adaptor subunit [Roseimaritima ulvae]|uniref:HlyD family secretion protein n=1 Tax=Roseimaritima ulvae TaxID=980254 RepID=A0A5B9QKK7_9BACT|nr:HlyD family efflux transporter periplasmic adaptor subunit [Roseimaritima ulvae]QEG38075.1 HlyD family secretion protein [Roseimaritima ulvae]
MPVTPPACVDITNSRPRVRDDLQITVHRDRQGEPWFRIVRPRAARSQRERFLRVGTAEYALLSHCDGQRTLEQARTAAALQHDPQRLSPERVEALLLWAQREGLLTGDHQQDDAARQAQTSGKQSLTWIRVPLLHGGPWLNSLVRLTGWVFSPLFALLAVTLWGLAMGVAISDYARLTEDLRAILTPAGWLRLAIVWVGLKLIHEAAHAISCHKFGGRVGEIGVAWMIVAPVAYVDLTDVYRIPSRWRRMVTSLAGVYVELTVAAVALLGWSQTHSPTAAYLLSTIAMTAGLASVLFNLNPLMRLDGYFALTDWLDRPNLATDAQATLRGAVAWLCLGIRPKRTHFGGSAWGLLVYGIGSLGYRISVITALLIAGIQMYQQAGMLLAAIVIVTLLARPLYQTLRSVVMTTRQRPAALLRLTGVVALVAAVSLAATRIPYPSETGWEAVTEFVDDAPVRAQAAGFVAQVHVRDGQSVQAGEPLVVLENRSLAVQLAAARAQWQTALANSRYHRQQHETGQAIANQRTAAALGQRVEDLQSQIEHLTVRAPRAGVVIAEDLEHSLGQWTDEGQAIGYVVDPAAIKAIVAVPQSKLDGLSDRLQQPLQVVVGEQRIPATLISIAEQTSSVAPHPCLAATAGGPLATRPQEDPRAGELLEPHLKLEVRLTQPPRSARGGQPARVVSQQR